MTQAALADAAGIRQATVSDIERGSTTRVDLETLERLANALGVDAALLIEHTNRPGGHMRRQAFGTRYHARGGTEEHRYEECSVGSAIGPQDRIDGIGDGLSACGECDRIRDANREDVEGRPAFGKKKPG